MEKQPRELEKTFVNYAADKGLIFRLYNELKKLNSDKTVKKWARDWEET